MEREDPMERTEGSAAFETGGLEEEAGVGAPVGRRAPSFRAWAISIIAAVVLSVTATLLLGGTFGFTAGVAGGPGCGPATSCCPPAGTRK